MRPQHSEFGFGCPGHRFSKKMPSSLSYDGVPCCFTCSSRTLLACLAAFGAVRFPHAVSLFVGFGLALHVRACPFLPALTNSYRFLCFPTSGFFDKHLYNCYPSFHFPPILGAPGLDSGPTVPARFVPCDWSTKFVQISLAGSSHYVLSGGAFGGP